MRQGEESGEKEKASILRIVMSGAGILVAYTLCLLFDQYQQDISNLIDRLTGRDVTMIRIMTSEGPVDLEIPGVKPGELEVPDSLALEDTNEAK